MTATTDSDELKGTNIISYIILHSISRNLVLIAGSGGVGPWVPGVGLGEPHVLRPGLVVRVWN